MLPVTVADKQIFQRISAETGEWRIADDEMVVSLVPQANAEERKEGKGVEEGWKRGGRWKAGRAC